MLSYTVSIYLPLGLLLDSKQSINLKYSPVIYKKLLPSSSCSLSFPHSYVFPFIIEFDIVIMKRY